MTRQNLRSNRLRPSVYYFIRIKIIINGWHNFKTRINNTSKHVNTVTSGKTWISRISTSRVNTITSGKAWSRITTKTPFSSRCRKYSSVNLPLLQRDSDNCWQLCLLCEVHKVSPNILFFEWVSYTQIFTFPNNFSYLNFTFCF